MLGNYDTSLFLKAQVDNLQGRNEELRNELKQTRLETSKSRLETQKAIEKVLFKGHILIRKVLRYQRGKQRP